MKKFIAWTLRLCCFAVIGVAAYTLVQCLIHVNDDHSAERLMESSPVETFQSETAVMSGDSSILTQENQISENPTVALSADGSATVGNPTVTVTAAFTNIVSSIVADLSWYVDGELVQENADCLLVEGSTMSLKATVDLSDETTEQAEVTLSVAFQDKDVEAQVEIPVERMVSEDSVVIRTEEITVTAQKRSSIYDDDELEHETGQTMARSDTGLLLGYVTDNSGLSALRLQFSDGSEGWVDADNMEITDEDCTTDEDYTEEQKMEFVNSMRYDSKTDYLVWVSLYTQKVNVFTGYKGHWTLAESFDCASGVNETPTTTGIYRIEMIKERWNFGKTYVEPVLIFNGGEAFTSRPFDAETDEITDETMGRPASGGGVRLLEEDIAWMAEHLPVETTVVVY